MQVKTVENQAGGRRTRVLQKIRANGACAILLICVTALPVFAQSASFRSVDTNSNQVLSRNELIAAFGARGAKLLLSQSDHNGDGRLTISELRRESIAQSDERNDEQNEAGGRRESDNGRGNDHDSRGNDNDNDDRGDDDNDDDGDDGGDDDRGNDDDDNDDDDDDDDD